MIGENKEPEAYRDEWKQDHYLLKINGSPASTFPTKGALKEYVDTLLFKANFPGQVSIEKISHNPHLRTATAEEVAELRAQQAAKSGVSSIIRPGQG